MLEIQAVIYGIYINHKLPMKPHRSPEICINIFVQHFFATKYLNEKKNYEYFNKSPEVYPKVPIHPTGPELIYRLIPILYTIYN